MKYKYVIIGAGPTGLGAAHRLKELGEENFTIIERSSFPGGLATSFKDEKGFLWDIGGHVQFSHYNYFNDLMVKILGKDGWLEHERESWVWMKDCFIPYPFQNNIRYLSKKDMWSCLQGIIEIYKNKNKVINHFEDWIIARFGRGIADLFMLPYNKKVWAYPAEDLAYNWVGERVAISDLERVTKNVLYELDDLSWGPNNTFKFPKYGGTGAIWKGLANLIGANHFLFNKAVEKINTTAQQICLSDGSVIEYENLLSTAPVDWLTSSIEEISKPTVLKASRLKHSTSHIVGIGLKGKPKEELASKCWMYFPEDNCPFYRVTVFSNYSPNNVPDITKNWSLMAETSDSPSKPVDTERLIENTIQGMLNTKLIERKSDIISTWKYTAEYGYPTPCVNRDNILESIMPEIEQRGVYSRGRFGAWKYEVSNQDHSVMQGVEWVNRMVLNIPEVTLHFPVVANANWGKNL